ncbi:hypothetical protein [uncultured Rikenella sp.]|uniref:hypothetical protein n=1 Tax=uncultured Rikenella sp. TaxID=368003 RepID=UPI00272D81D8|nr:hypothetical protein [uncultured Rikenella sp.]
MSDLILSDCRGKAMPNASHIGLMGTHISEVTTISMWLMVVIIVSFIMVEC